MSDYWWKLGTKTSVAYVINDCRKNIICCGLCKIKCNWTNFLLFFLLICRSRWSSDYRARHWTQCSPVQTWEVPTFWEQWPVGVRFRLLLFHVHGAEVQQPVQSAPQPSRWAWSLTRLTPTRSDLRFSSHCIITFSSQRPISFRFTSI
jgi:hypothetical protein